MWIILHPVTGERLCGDNKWRWLATFGTYKECVRTYRHKGHAQRMANKHNFHGQTHIIRIGDGQSIDASGRIMQTFPAEKPGFVIYKEVKPAEEIKILKKTERN